MECKGSKFEVKAALIQCVVCKKGEGKDLRLLKCSHSCCLQCLRTKHTLISCPLCSYETRLPRNLEEMTKNFLLDTAHAFVSLTEPKPCVLCESLGQRTVSTSICFDCQGDTLCDSCTKAHRTLRLSKSHKPVSFANITNQEGLESKLKLLQKQAFCTQHAYELVQFYCVDCDDIICQVCRVEDHRAHDCSKIEEVGEEALFSLSAQLEPISPNIDNAKSRIATLEKKLSNLQHTEDDLVNKTHERTEELVTTLRNRGAEQIADIRSTYGRQKHHTENHLNRLRHLKVRAEDTKSFTEMFKLLPDLDVIRQYDFMARTLQELSTHMDDLLASLQDDPTSYQSLTSPLIEVRVLENLSKAFVEMTAKPENIVGRMAKLKLGAGNGSLVKALSKATFSEHRVVELTCVATVQTTMLDIMHGIDVTDDGDILVAGIPKSQSPHCIEVFTLTGDAKPFIKVTADEVADLHIWQNSIYITDKVARKVTQLEKSGNVLATYKLPEKEQACKGEEGLSVAISPTGDMFISSYYGDALYRCPKGQTQAVLYRNVKGHRYLSDPYCIRFSSIGDLIVSRGFKQAVSMCELPDTMKWSYGTLGRDSDQGGQLSDPTGVCSDSAGHVFIADYLNHRVVALSPEGSLICHLVTQHEHHIDGPRCVAVSTDGEALVVGHSHNKISIFTVSK